jgi:Ca2+-binding EF-hand superfamily protein
MRRISIFDILMRKPRTPRITGVLLLLVLLRGVAVAASTSQPPPGPPPTGASPPRSIMEASPLLNAIDADHDHVVSATELDSAPAALRTLDTNADGKLTRNEAGMRPGPGGPGGPGGRSGEPPQTPAPGPTADELLSMLMTFDKNKDGTLQKSEVPERQAGLFERGDTNADGALDGAELRKVTTDQAAAPVAPPRAGAGRRGFPRFDVAATTLDKDANGEIGDDEMAGATTALKVLDKNADGRLTEDELTPPPPPAEAPRGAQR